MSEADNRMRWNRGPGHYEVWYLTLNHRASETGYWIRYTLCAPTAPHRAPTCQLWFASFDARQPARTFGLHRSCPIEALKVRDQPFALELGGATLGNDRAAGALSGRGHDVAWDLAWSPATTTHLHLPAFAYRTDFADTRVVAPNLDVAMRGRITVDGHIFDLAGEGAGEPGGQSHVWGRKHAQAWAWAHCNGFRGGRRAALEALTFQIVRCGITLPALSLLSLYLDDTVYHFREPHEALLVRGHPETGAYRLTATGARTRIDANLTCRPDDLVLTPYVDPDGEAAFCHNTEIADCHVMVSERRGLRWMVVAELYAPKAGHFEVGARQPDPAVLARHIAI